MLLHEAITARRSCRHFAANAVSVGTVERLLWAGQGVTDDDGNRTTPSAHALHAVRLRVVAGHVEGLAAGVYGATGADLELEPDVLIHGDMRGDIEQAAYDEQPWIGQAAAIICLCSDMRTPAREFAEQMPYGLRGKRYVHVEIGAVAQNIALQATEEDVGAVLVAGFRDDAVAAALHLAPDVAPIALMCIGKPA